MRKYKKDDTYFRTVLLLLIEDLIKKYDGITVVDEYGTSKFENGKWLVNEDGKFVEMKYKTMDISDLASEIETLVEGINKTQTIILGISVNNTGII